MKNSIQQKFVPGVMLGLVLGLGSCSEDLTEQPNPTNVEINSDQAALSSRMTLLNEEVTVDGVNGGRVAADFSLQLKAQLTPPSIEGNLLQATSIDERADYFVVGYNYKGEQYYGGLDLVSSQLELKSQILYADADISDVSFSGDELFFAGATSSSDEPAFVEKVMVKTDKETFSLDNNARTSLGYYVANSITTDDNNVYVTVGDDQDLGGGLHHLDLNLNTMDHKKVADARWATTHDSEVLVLSGATGKVHGYEKGNLSSERTFNHQSSSADGSRVTVSAAGDYVFVAGGTAGLLVYDMEGDFVTKYSFGEGAYTNAVTAHDGLLFISNSEAGVYVAQYDPFIEVIGKLRLESGDAVNQILYKENTLYVSTGTGGVKMIEVQK